MGIYISNCVTHQSHMMYIYILMQLPVHHTPDHMITMDVHLHNQLCELESCDHHWTAMGKLQAKKPKPKVLPVEFVGGTDRRGKRCYIESLKPFPSCWPLNASEEPRTDNPIQKSSTGGAI